jgi:O-antigen/teichoic acid export membrane protein
MDIKELVTTVADQITSLVRWPSVVWQMFRLVSGGILLMGLWLVLARWWGVEEFGQFNYLFAYVAVCGLCCDFGLDVLLTRHVAHSGPQTPKVFLITKFLVTTGSFVVFLVLGWSLDMPIAVIALLFGVVLLSCTNFCDGILRGEDRLDIEAKIGVVQKIVFVGGSVLGVIFLGAQMLWVALCYLLSQGFGLVITARILALKGWYRISVDDRSVRRALYAAWPLWAVALLMGMAVRVDMFILEWLMGERAVGIYSAAARIIEGLVIAGVSYSTAIFPRIVKNQGDRIRIQVLIRWSLVVLLAGSFVIVIAGYAISPWLINTLFGRDYGESINILRLLLPSLAVVYVTCLLGYVCVAMDKQRLYLSTLGVALITNAIVDYWAVHNWGVMGVVVGYWAREGVLLGLLLILVMRAKVWTARSSTIISP